MHSTTSPASLGPFQTASANWSAQDKEQGPAQRRKQRRGKTSSLWSQGPPPTQMQAVQALGPYQPQTQRYR